MKRQRNRDKQKQVAEATNVEERVEARIQCRLDLVDQTAALISFMASLASHSPHITQGRHGACDSLVAMKL